MIRPAKRQDFIAIAGTLAENHRRALHALAPDTTPVEPLTRLADIHPAAVTFERDGRPGCASRPIVVAGAVGGAPGASSIFVFSAADATDPELLETAQYFFAQLAAASAP
jgi:hypothetical protein